MQTNTNGFWVSILYLYCIFVQLSMYELNVLKSAENRTSRNIHKSNRNPTTGTHRINHPKKPVDHQTLWAERRHWVWIEFSCAGRYYEEPSVFCWASGYPLIHTYMTFAYSRDTRFVEGTPAAHSSSMYKPTLSIHTNLLMQQLEFCSQDRAIFMQATWQTMNIYVNKTECSLHLYCSITIFRNNSNVQIMWNTPSGWFDSN